MTKVHNFQYYYTMLCQYIDYNYQNKEKWDGKIVRKLNIPLYKWWVEIRNGRRKLKPNEKLVLLSKGLNLNDMVSDYICYSFEKWLHIFEDYLHSKYYYGIQSNRSDKAHITEWSGVLKRDSGNFKGNNLYEWFQRVRNGKFKTSEEQKNILKALGLKIDKQLINKRINFNEWVEIIKEYKNERGGNNWDGIIDTSANKYKNRNLYEFINSLRDKKLSDEQYNKLIQLGVKTCLKRKK